MAKGIRAFQEYLVPPSLRPQGVERGAGGVRSRKPEMRIASSEEIMHFAKA